MSKDLGAADRDRTQKPRSFPAREGRKKERLGNPKALVGDARFLDKLGMTWGGIARCGTRWSAQWVAADLDTRRG